MRQAATESGLKDWSNIVPSIYSQCFTGMRISQEGWCKHCESIDHTSESCPLRSMAHKRPHPMGGYSSYSKRTRQCSSVYKIQQIQWGFQVWHELQVSTCLQCMPRGTSNSKMPRVGKTGGTVRTVTWPESEIQQICLSCY